MCRREIGRDAVCWRCREHCDYNVCLQCWAKHWAHGSSQQRASQVSNVTRPMESWPPPELPERPSSNFPTVPATVPATTYKPPEEAFVHYSDAGAGSQPDEFFQQLSQPLMDPEPEAPERANELPPGTHIGETIICAVIWFVLPPMMMKASDEVLTRLEFPCPWLALTFSHAGGAGFLSLAELALTRLPIAPGQCDSCEILSLSSRGQVTLQAQTQEEQKVYYIKIAILVLIQALEIGCGNLAQEGISLAMRTEVHMLTPAVVLLALVYLRKLSPSRGLYIWIFCATVGGMLAVPGFPGRISVGQPLMLVLAIFVRGLVLAKWIVAQEWLISPFAVKPPLMQLGVRILGGAALVGLLVSFIFQRDCFGLAVARLPGQLLLFFLVLSLSRALHMAAELRMLQLTSIMLLGFLHPFRYVALDVLGVFASSNGSLPVVQLVGVAVCVVAGIGYQQTASDTMRPAVNKYEEVYMRECHKTILKPGDGIHFPKRGESVSIRYDGWLSDTRPIEVFDSGVFDVDIGVGQIIKGMDAGIASMSLGEVAVLRIPAGYAYGKHGMMDVIPPNADLTFEIELLLIN